MLYESDEIIIDMSIIQHIEKKVMDYDSPNEYLPRIGELCSVGIWTDKSTWNCECDGPNNVLWIHNSKERNRADEFLDAYRKFKED